jgi:hypothetical protein
LPKTWNVFLASAPGHQEHRNLEEQKRLEDAKPLAAMAGQTAEQSEPMNRSPMFKPCPIPLITAKCPCRIARIEQLCNQKLSATSMLVPSVLPHSNGKLHLPGGVLTIDWIGVVGILYLLESTTRSPSTSLEQPWGRLPVCRRHTGFAATALKIISLWFLFMLYLLITEVFRSMANAVREIAFYFFWTAVALPSYRCCSLDAWRIPTQEFSGGPYEPLYLLLFFVLIWIYDTGAYLFWRQLWQTPFV